MVRRSWYILASILLTACSNPTSSQRAPAQRGNDQPANVDESDPMDEGESPNEEPPPNNGGGGDTCFAAQSGFRKMASIPDLPKSTTVSSAVWAGKEMFVLVRAAYCSGGACTTRITARAYNPATNTWRTLAAPPFVADPHFAVSAWDGSRWLLIGGMLFSGGDVIPVTGGYAFDPKTNAWSTIPDAPIDIRGVRGVFADSTKEVVVSSGAGAAYNSATKTWRRIADGPVREYANNMVYANGRVVVAFPEHVPEEGCDCSVAVNIAASYDPKTDAWVTLPAAPAAHSWANSVAMGNSATFFAGWSHGGDGDFPNLHDGVYWDSAAWHTIPEPPWTKSTAYIRSGLSVFSAKGKLYVWGGQYIALSSTDPMLIWPTDGFIFDPATSTWSAMPSGGPSGSEMATLWTGCDAIMFGGFNGDAFAGQNHGMLFRP
jgi:N-acetylneuraminic acid mutarotase